MDSFGLDRRIAPALLSSALCLGAAPGAGAAVTDYVKVERVATGLSRPVYATAAPGDTGRLFILEQHTGQVRVLDLVTGALNPAPFLVVPGLSTGSEQGLLGMAFHPDYGANGYFYVNYTGSDGATKVVRYQVSPLDPELADPASATTILTIDQPQANHNGGWVGFGPDGYLYVSSGDGGGSNDDATGHTTGTGNAQDLTGNLLGKMLRLDVDGDDFPADPGRNYAVPPSNPFVGVQGDDEIWSYGLRNPWRASFDRATGDLHIGDVGQGAREEIDFQPAGSPGGENYGWRLREGSIETPAAGIGGAPPPGAVEPIYDYPHGSGPSEGNSVTGGYVYRGPVIPLWGKYFFGDFVNRRVWSLEHDGAGATEFIDWTSHLVPDQGTIGNVSSFAEDAAGNLYVVDFDGEIFRLSPVCTLALDLGYEDGSLVMDFGLGADVPTTWSAWLLRVGGGVPLWALPLPGFPETTVSVPVPGFPSVGTVVVLSFLTTGDALLCVAIDAVNTGLP